MQVSFMLEIHEKDKLPLANAPCVVVPFAYFVLHLIIVLVHLLWVITFFREILAPRGWSLSQRTRQTFPIAASHEFDRTHFYIHILVLCDF